MEDLFDEYERFRAIGNESIHDYFVRFHKLVNDMKITQLNIPTHQMNTKFVNNLPAYWGKFDDDEVVPTPPAVPITPVNVPAAPAHENANGSPSTTVISEGAPIVTESLLSHQIPLPDTSDSQSAIAL
ncbi:hypothetical protein Tco_0441378 [Tanacetum coccineum]